VAGSFDLRVLALSVFRPDLLADDVNSEGPACFQTRVQQIKLGIRMRRFPDYSVHFR
jgi:hypothetical protein